MSRFLVIIILILTCSDLTAAGGLLYKVPIYAEEFSLPWQSSWPLGTKDGLEKEMHGGSYLLTNTTTKAKVISLDVPIDTDRDFEIEMALKIDTAPDKSVHGINWGMSGKKDYGFYFTGKQNFSIARWDGSYDNYQDYTTTAKIKRRRFNHMVVKRKGYHMLFYINGSLMHRMPFRNFYGKGLGIQVGANSCVRVDFVRAAYLTDTKPSPVEPDSAYVSVVESPYRHVFHDDFIRTENSWPKSTKELETDCGKGFLNLENKTDTYQSAIRTESFNFQRDFTITAQISQTGGAEENETALLIGDPAGFSLRFGFTPGGYCTVYTMDEKGQAHILLDFTYLPSIHFNMAKPNGTELCISKRGGYMYFFVNGELVYMGPSVPGLLHAFGFLAGPGASFTADYLRADYN